MCILVYGGVGFGLCDLWTNINQLHIFTVTKKRSYIHSSIDVVLCLSLHVHNRVENVLKRVLFYVHNIKVMMEEIGLPIRKLSLNTSLYPIVGQTKTRKFLLTRMKIKYNVTILWYHVIQFFTWKRCLCKCDTIW